MGALAEWIVEFEVTTANTNNVFSTHDGSAGVAPPENGWARLAEGTFKECRGHIRAGTMNARPLESCIKRAHKMVQRSPGVPVRMRNIKTGEVIPADILA